MRAWPSAVACLVVAACNASSPAPDTTSSDAPTTPAADAGSSTGEDPGAMPSTDSGSASSDASKTPATDAAPSPMLSACSTSTYPCDPIADTGCPTGQHCMVTLDKKSPKVACQAAGTTAPVGEGSGNGDCNDEPCRAGYACHAALGLCFKVCDPTVGGTPVPGYVGRRGSPQCATSYGKDCNAGPTSTATCFGVCDNFGYGVP